jgi:hypothetical protein
MFGKATPESLRAPAVHPGNGLAAVIRREQEAARGRPGEGLYYGSAAPLAPGTGLSGDPARAGLTGLERWAAAVVVAWSIRDATVIAAVRFEHEVTAVPAPALRIYRVDAMPFHSGPLAVIQELYRRGVPHDGLVREYWAPSDGWHIQEVLVPSLVVLEEVEPLSQREIYVPRWVLYRQDAERAQALA